MKNRLFKRMVALLMSCIMLFAFSAMAYAAEPVEENMEYCVEEVQIIPRGSTIIPAYGSATIDVISVRGSKTGKLTIVTASKAPDSNTITWDFVNATYSNNRVSHGNTGVNDMYESPLSITLTTGDYKLVVKNNASKDTIVHAYFN